MTDRICRWGILGAAQIAHKNWKAIRNAANCDLVAVASRDGQRARQFIAECQADSPLAQTPRAVGSYEELLADSSIDAVYLPLPTLARKSWAIRAAEAGKHILCEKPVGHDASDVQEIVDACRKHQVQFMDGVMFMHSRRLDAMRQVLDDGRSIGRIKRIMSQFSFGGSDDFLRENIRMNSSLEPLGCLGDLGWYNLRFTLWVMREELPVAVCGRLLAEQAGRASPEPIPTEFSGELLYPDGISAGFYCSFLTGLQQWAHVSGTRGYLHVRDFVLPFFGPELSFDVSNLVFNVRCCDFNMEDHTRRFAVAEYGNGTDSAQETRMFEAFARLVLSGQPDPAWGEISLNTQRVLDACLHSARAGGVQVPLNP